jgi:hypothetical protein
MSTTPKWPRTADELHEKCGSVRSGPTSRKSAMVPVSSTLARCRVMRRFERAPPTPALPPIPDVLLSRSKRRSGPIGDIEEYPIDPSLPRIPNIGTA